MDAVRIFSPSFHKKFEQGGGGTEILVCDITHSLWLQNNQPWENLDVQFCPPPQYIQKNRSNWYPSFLITLKMKTCNESIAIYMINCVLNICICSGFSEMCTHFFLLSCIFLCVISTYTFRIIFPPPSKTRGRILKEICTLCRGFCRILISFRIRSNANEGRWFARPAWSSPIPCRLFVFIYRETGSSLRQFNLCGFCTLCRGFCRILISLRIRSQVIF